MTEEETVLTIDTKALLDRHRDEILLSGINSGQTLYVPQPRGKSTFLPLAAYPTDGGKVGTKTKPKIVELVVEGGVPNVAGLVTKVERVHNGNWEQYAL